MDPRAISIDEYDYDLPSERIALHPLGTRDASKLLVWNQGNIQEDVYNNIAKYLPPESLLIFNNTRVLPARILFTKETGAVIEIFCLEPFEPRDYHAVMGKEYSVEWKCMIGGASKWKGGSLTKTFHFAGENVRLTALLKNKLGDAYVVELSWTPSDHTFAEILDVAGEMPLPPYIKRMVDESDKERYQTIYANEPGSVAAPTAGLHFTPDVFLSMRSRNISAEFLTLHVGAGTFKPVKSKTIGQHEMHAEWMEVDKDFLEKIAQHRDKIFAVGTTSLRTLESLYWMGVKTIIDPSVSIHDIDIKQWEVYDIESSASVEESMNSLFRWMVALELNSLIVKTGIIITPGYKFRVINGLITNFHQPRSTLLLLVAAMAGAEWKKIYQHAVDNDFRFLSYGDGCLIYLQEQIISG